MSVIDYQQLLVDMRHWAVELGFQQLAVSDGNLSAIEPYFDEWLARGFMGEMGYMAKHGRKRTRPAELEPGTRRVISVRMDYLPAGGVAPFKVLNDPQLGYISRYALGRDYHKVLRKRLQKLAERMQQVTGEFGYRVFVDSAPVMEKPLAAMAGLGWIGKHTNLIHRRAGSWFFLGEIYTDLPLPVAEGVDPSSHCGRCQACIDVCPTRAIVAPYELDARRCISYLTIEYDGFISEPFASQIGNRIYGCDDCQLVCPWNRFAKTSPEADFTIRHALDAPRLEELFLWSDSQFETHFAGSPIRRIGYQRWQRNLVIALGNGTSSQKLQKLLINRKQVAQGVLCQQISWAIDKLDQRLSG